MSASLPAATISKMLEGKRRGRPNVAALAAAERKHRRFGEHGLQRPAPPVTSEITPRLRRMTRFRVLRHFTLKLTRLPAAWENVVAAMPARLMAVA
jgi:hypothetical protein